LLGFEDNRAMRAIVITATQSMELEPIGITLLGHTAYSADEPIRKASLSAKRT